MEKIFTTRAGLRTLTMAALVAGYAQAGAAELIVNGGFEADAFETYTPTGWNVIEDGQSGGVLATGANLSSATGFNIYGPASGNYFGLVEATTASRNALYQSFVSPLVTSAGLSFDLFVGNQAPSTIIGPTNFVYDAYSVTQLKFNQHARVDLLTASAGSFSTAGADVLASFFIGGSTAGWQHFSIDLTDYLAAGGTYQLRFANVANVKQLQLGVDNVSLEVTAVPEPESYALLLAGLGLLGAIARRRSI